MMRSVLWFVLLASIAHADAQRVAAKFNESEQGALAPWVGNLLDRALFAPPRLSHTNLESTALAKAQPARSFVKVSLSAPRAPILRTTRSRATLPAPYSSIAVLRSQFAPRAAEEPDRLNLDGININKVGDVKAVNISASKQVKKNFFDEDNPERQKADADLAAILMQNEKEQWSSPEVGKQWLAFGKDSSSPDARPLFSPEQFKEQFDEEEEEGGSADNAK